MKLGSYTLPKKDKERYKSRNTPLEFCWYQHFSPRISKFCFSQFDLVSLKAEVDKLDIDKLVPVPLDLTKLSDVVKKDIVKKAVYGKLVAKVNSIDT